MPDSLPITVTVEKSPSLIKVAASITRKTPQEQYGSLEFFASYSQEMPVGEGNVEEFEDHVVANAVTVYTKIVKKYADEKKKATAPSNA